jgi:diguanylate cyclase (GGDEF)-like protein
MLTQEMVTVLLIALAVNAIVVVSLVIAPRVRGWWDRRSARRDAAVRADVGPPPGPGSDAGDPWFVARSTNGAFSAERATAEPAPTAEPIVPMASSSSWASWLDEEAARATRYHRPVTIVFVELAGLGRLTDRVGAAAADRLIPPVAATIRRHARAADRLARLGPTRFGVLLVETDEIRAINYIERIRTNCDVWLAAGAVSVRLSVGWAEIRPDRSVEAAVAEAEQRLFDDRRRSEPADPEILTGGHDSLSAVLQASGT